MEYSSQIPYQGHVPKNNVGYQYWLELKSNPIITILTDITKAVSCISRQGTLWSDPLMPLPIKDPGVLFRPQDHPSAQTLLGQLNILADSRSRQSPIDTDWSLDLTTFIILWEEPWPLPYGPFPNRETTS